MIDKIGVSEDRNFVTINLECFIIEIKLNSLFFKNDFFQIIKRHCIEKIFSEIFVLHKFFNKKKKYYLSVFLTDDAEIKYYNRVYRNKNNVTNIISFPSNDFLEQNTKNGTVYFGDIIISVERIVLEAKNQSKRVEDHFLHIFLHGVLHLIGFDHKHENEAIKMENQEIKILKNIGILNPYKL